MHPNPQDILRFKQLYKVIDLFYFHIVTKNEPNIGTVTINGVKYTRKWVGQQIAQQEIFKQYHKKIDDFQEFAQNTEVFNDLIETLELRKHINAQIQGELNAKIDAGEEKVFEEQLEKIGELPEAHQEAALHKLTSTPEKHKTHSVKELTESQLKKTEPSDEESKAPPSEEPNLSTQDSVIDTTPNQPVYKPTPPAPAPVSSSMPSLRGSPNTGFSRSTTYPVTNRLRNAGSGANVFFKRNVIPGIARGIGGLAGIGNSGLSRGFGFANGVRGRYAAFSGNTSALGKKMGAARIVAFALIAAFGMLLIQGLIAPSIDPSLSPVANADPINTNSGGNLNTCTFTRSGVSKPIGSSKLQSIIQEISSKTGVPAAVLGSIAMHENPDFTMNSKDTHDAFKPYEQAGFSGVDCLPHFATSPTGALGFLQIQAPPHLRPQQAANYNPSASPVDGITKGLNFLSRAYTSLGTRDFCDIKTNAYMSAGTLISKNGGKAPTTGAEVKNAACAYYGACNYGAYNYGAEVQKDFEACVASAPVGTTPLPPGPIGFSVSCPLGASYKITCGTATNPANGCGHGHPQLYQACKAPPYAMCPFSPQLKAAIDVSATKTLAPVIAPFINGTQSVDWTLSQGPEAINNGSWGWKTIYMASYQGKTLTLDLTHISQSINPNKTVKSGEQIGTVYPYTDGDPQNIGHLHTAIAVNGTWVEPQKEANMCN